MGWGMGEGVGIEEGGAGVLVEGMGEGGCREWRRGGRGCGGGDGSGVVAVVEGIEEGGVGVLGERLGEGVCGGKG